MNWINQFDSLKKLDAELVEKLTSSSEVVSLEKDSVIFGPGKAPTHLVLLLEGCIRVHQLSDSGREIVLYRISAGDSCILTTACVLAYEDYSAEGVAETPIEAVMIPRDVFDELMGISKEFRHFVLTAFTKRLSDLFLVVEEVAFKRIDHRLAQKLIELSGSSSTVSATHQNLATELGSVREVVSRQMAEFQSRGWILQQRGMIEILDRHQLEQLIQL